jgi:hypothetical protein
MAFQMAKMTTKADFARHSQHFEDKGLSSAEAQPRPAQSAVTVIASLSPLRHLRVPPRILPPEFVRRKNALSEVVQLRLSVLSFDGGTIVSFLVILKLPKPFYAKCVL